MIVLTLLLLGFFYISVNCENGLISIPFFGIDTTVASSLPTGRKHLQDNVNVPLENIEVAYLIDLSIGTPPQPFILLLDTGSSSSWVPSYGCGRYCGYPIRTMLPSNSTTFVSTNMVYSVNYGQGYSHGLYAQDTFTVNNVSVPEAYFGLSFVNDGQLKGAGADGILGLGPDSLTKFSNPESKTFPTLVTSMFDHGIIEKNEFSVYFHPLENNTATLASPINGEITFGGVNPMHTNDTIIYAPMTTDETFQNFWAIDIDDISIGNKSITIDDDDLIGLIDTGSTLIYLPSPITQELFDKVDGFGKSNGLYEVPCNSTQLQSITFHINDNQLVLNPEDYIIRYGKLATNEETCGTYLMDSPSGFGIILGYGFLQQFVTVFDNQGKQIGFSRRLENN